MKKTRTKILSIVTALILIITFFVGCKSTKVDEKASLDASLDQKVSAGVDTDISTSEDKSSAESKDTSISVTDMTEKVIVLDATAKKIVVLTPSDCEIIYALGAGDTVVGRGEYCDYPEQVADIPVVNSGADTNIEQIIALEPEVVIMSTMSQTKEHTAALSNAGIKVISTDAKNIAGVYEAINIIGAVTGKNEEAKALIEGMDKSFNEIASDINPEDVSGKTIYFEISPLEYGLWTAGKGTFMNEIAQMLGLTNAFEDIDGWNQVSEEQVLLRNPDYIFTVTMYMGSGPLPEEEIMLRKGWENIKAVVNKNVFSIDSDELSRPCPRLVDGAKTLKTLISKK